MGNSFDKLIELKLRQARRKERPYNLIKIIFIGAILVVLAGLSCNCAAGHDSSAKLSKQQVKHNTDAIWGDHTEARKRRIP